MYVYTVYVQKTLHLFVPYPGVQYMLALSSTYFQLSKVHVCTFPPVICVACRVHVVRSVHTRVSGIRVCTTRGCARITQADSHTNVHLVHIVSCVLVANSDIVI